jgi:hypothetical protein
MAGASLPWPAHFYGDAPNASNKYSSLVRLDNGNMRHSCGVF